MIYKIILYRSTYLPTTHLSLHPSLWGVETIPHCTNTPFHPKSRPSLGRTMKHRGRAAPGPSQNTVEGFPGPVGDRRRVRKERQ